MEVMWLGRVGFCGGEIGRICGEIGRVFWR